MNTAPSKHINRLSPNSIACSAPLAFLLSLLLLLSVLPTLGAQCPAPTVLISHRSSSGYAEKEGFPQFWYYPPDKNIIKRYRTRVTTADKTQKDENDAEVCYHCTTTTEH